MAIYRKGDDQSPLFNKAREQEKSHVSSQADNNGYMVGLNPLMTVKEYETMGGGPISAKGMRKGASALHWQRKNPGPWKAAGFTLSDEMRPPNGKG
jgi:hypothetical protein